MQKLSLTGSATLALALATVAVPRIGRAQTEPSQCAVAVAAVDRGDARSAHVDLLASCPRTGPGALARLWSDAKLSSDLDMASVAQASMALRDVGLYRAVLSSSQDSRLSVPMRLAALEVLAAYYSPELAASSEYLTSARVGDPIPGSVHHALSSGAAETLPDQRRREIATLLALLVQSDPDPVVRGAALRLRQGLAYRDPKNIPVQADVVSLAAGCGPRVTLQSRADISLPLRVRVLGTSYDQTFWLKGLVNGQPSKIPLALPRGTVVAGVGDQELTRLSKRDAPCPPGLTKRYP